MKDDLSRPPFTPLLAVEDLWVSYDRIDAVRGVSFARGRWRDRHPHRGQRGGEVIDLAGHIRDAAGGPGPGDPGRPRPPGGAGPPAGGPGHRPRPGGPGHLRQPDGPGKSAPGDLPAPGRRNSAGSGGGLPPLPPVGGAAAAVGQYPVRRRAADAGGGPGLDEPGQAPAAG